LHAIPYSVAPLDQLRVPMVFWSSDGLVARMGLDLGCVRQQTHKPLSHDHFFHSVLGLLDITLPLADGLYGARWSTRDGRTTFDRHGRQC
jgi:lipid A ethanolaminephosphotransferase